jgi:secreted trypsin-like serine protease
LCYNSGGRLPRIPEKGFKHYRDVERTNRIVGGEPAALGDSPWTVALLIQSGSDYFMPCGGCILSPTKIASAANCVHRMPTHVFRARAGSIEKYAGGQLVVILTYLEHELYLQSGNRYDNDIALLYVDPRAPIIIDGVIVNALTLPQQDQPVADGTIGMISGWGSTIVS